MLLPLLQQTRSKQATCVAAALLWGHAMAAIAAETQLEAAALPASVLAADDAPFAGLAVPASCDTLGVAHDCFDVLGSTALNVGSFFDVRQASSSKHYFLKLFRNETGADLLLTGMGFIATSSGSGVNRFEAAGAILLGTDLVFPRSDALRNLREADVPVNLDNSMTCVGFRDAIGTKGERLPAVLAPGEAAWIVLRWPDLASGQLLRIRVDADANDQPCDFLTNDSGETYYRPDPRHGPFYDWGIRVFTKSTTAAPEPLPSPSPTWTLVKSLYR